MIWQDPSSSPTIAHCEEEEKQQGAGGSLGLLNSSRGDLLWEHKHTMVAALGISVVGKLRQGKKLERLG